MTILAEKIASAWGPAFTKFAKGEDMNDFKSIFTSVLTLVVNGKDGTETTMKVGNEGDSGVDTPWEALYNNGKEKLDEQQYEETECDCLAVLGNRMIMQTCRYNISGEIYLKAFSLCHITVDGKVSKVETFADPDLFEIEPIKEEHI